MFVRQFGLLSPMDRRRSSAKTVLCLDQFKESAPALVPDLAVCLTMGNLRPNRQESTTRMTNRNDDLTEMEGHHVQQTNTAVRNVVCKGRIPREPIVVEEECYRGKEGTSLGLAKFRVRRGLIAAEQPINRGSQAFFIPTTDLSSAVFKQLDHGSKPFYADEVRPAATVAF